MTTLAILTELAVSGLPYMRFMILAAGCWWAFAAYLVAKDDKTPAAYADAGLALLWVILAAVVIR
jgi:hypothetical protein